MRKANTNDLFKIARLVNELNLKQELFEAQDSEEDVSKIGYDFIFAVLSKASTEDAQQKIYEVLANPFEITPKEVGELDIDVLIQNCMECFNFSTIRAFIKRVNP